MIRPMDFVRLTSIDKSKVIKDTENHIGLVKEVSRDGRMSIIWIGETYSQLAWFKSSELEVVDNLVSILTCGLANFRCDEYIGYKFVRMCDGSMIPVFSSGCGCCGVNNGQLFERTWDELLDIINNQNKPMDKRTEVDELY